MATILRHKRRRDFTVLPNGMLRDPRLSFRATGLLAFLLMLPDGEGVDSMSLAERKKEGRDAIRAGFKELEVAGYLARHREQDEKGFWSHVIEVSDEPTTPFQSSDDRRRDNRPSDSQSLKNPKNQQPNTDGGARTDSEGGIFLPGTGWLGGKAS